MESNKSILVVSAHAADFVWRAGGAIALCAGRGYRVRTLCLSHGERGESERLWRQPGMTLDRVKASRRAESEKAAGILGAEIRFFDSGDYPIRATEETVHEMVVEFRTLQPEFVLTHSFADPYNIDHPDATNLTLRTRVYAQAAGYPAEGKNWARRPFSSSSRTSLNSASSSRRCCSTSRRFTGSSAKPWSRWRRRNTAGSITPTSPGVAAPRRCGTPDARRSSTRRLSNGSIRRCRASFHEAVAPAVFAAGDVPGEVTQWDRS